MFEKVNPDHPDKIADRIAGAIVDLAYLKNYLALHPTTERDIHLNEAIKCKDNNPKIAVEVLIGHGVCYIIIESSVELPDDIIKKHVWEIMGSDFTKVDIIQVAQDKHLAKNQSERIKCGDNGIFTGRTTTVEQQTLTDLANKIYNKFKADGKYIHSGKRMIVCQSNATEEAIAYTMAEFMREDDLPVINPLGEWTGGTNVDTGATNRKLGSDMGDAVTGGGLHGKDLSKADVTVNIFLHLLANQEKSPSRLIKGSCAIGDTEVRVTELKDTNIVETRIDYESMVELAREYVAELGGFEEFAKWGLIRPSK